jgi:hypothetical protein
MSTQFKQLDDQIILHWMEQSYSTSVNLVHNAPVELPPARSFPTRAPPQARAGPPPPGPSPLVLAPATRAGPPPLLAPSCQLGNNCHRDRNSQR